MTTTRLLTALMLGVLVAGTIRLAHAQNRPTIVYFNSTLAGISLTEAEQGLATTTLEWVVQGLLSEHRLALEVYRAGAWEAATPADSALPQRGRVAVTVTHSQSFAVPTYRLRIVDGTGADLDMWVLTIPYLVPDSPPVPTLSFNPISSAVVATGGGSGTLEATWAVTDRLPTHALRFTQFMASGDAFELDPLPPLAHWVPSTGSLALPVTIEPTSAQVTVRLEVIDVLSDAILASADVSVPLTLGGGGLDRSGGSGGVIAGNQPPAFVTASVSQTTANYGDTLIIRWQNRGTVQRFTCTVRLGTAAPLVVVDSTEGAGSVAYVLPAGSYSQAEFTLTVTDTAGLSRTRVDIVTMLP